jgi:hypothetical protein
MLPSWVHDTEILLGIVTAVPVVGGWLLYLLLWLGRGAQPKSPSPREDISPRRQQVTILGSLKAWIIDITINPQVPLSHERTEDIIAAIRQ